ncbi:unnamed protein product [Citrullus colocynthis]|uniref:TF-B3 domain-containing protein n=1 Tax=Citrullus colocynthis TaxID=252529 RepID=A0ABP0YPB9_9ROSI
MDDHHNPHHHHHHDLPPFPSAAAILHSPPPPPPPQNSCYLPPILSQTYLGFSSSAPQSYFYSNPPPLHEQLPSHFPPSSTFLTYGFNEPTNSLFPKDEGRRAMDAWSTKVARTNRRLARQRTLTLTRTTSSSSSAAYNGCNNDEYSKGLTITHFPNADPAHNNRNLFTFCTPDNKILRMLLKKELKNSDVGSLGRIVLPKREAEENLPFLTDKEGIQIVVRDVNSIRKWTMKYKYWANNRSRMYVLENTGEFVRQNGLLMGDSMTLYEDDCKNLYVAVEKGENHSRMEENYKQQQQQQQQQCGNLSNMEIKDEEEDASLALLIEELKHKADDDPHAPPCCNDYSYFAAATMMGGATIKGNYNNINNNNNATNTNYKEVMEDLQGINNNNNNNNGNGFEDCFGGLDTLPEVTGFKFPLFDYFSNNDRT